RRCRRRCPRASPWRPRPPEDRSTWSVTARTACCTPPTRYGSCAWPSDASCTTRNCGRDWPPRPAPACGNAPGRPSTTCSSSTTARSPCPAPASPAPPPSARPGPSPRPNRPATAAAGTGWRYAEPDGAGRARPLPLWSALPAPHSSPYPVSARHSVQGGGLLTAHVVEHLAETVQVGADPRQRDRVLGRQRARTLRLGLPVQQAGGHPHPQRVHALPELRRGQHPHPVAVQQHPGEVGPAGHPVLGGQPLPPGPEVRVQVEGGLGGDDRRPRGAEPVGDGVGHGPVQPAAAVDQVDDLGRLAEGVGRGPLDRPGGAGPDLAGDAQQVGVEQAAPFAVRQPGHADPPAPQGEVLAQPGGDDGALRRELSGAVHHRGRPPASRPRAPYRPELGAATAMAPPPARTSAYSGGLLPGPATTRSGSVDRPRRPQ